MILESEKRHLNLDSDCNSKTEIEKAFCIILSYYRMHHIFVFEKRTKTVFSKLTKDLKLTTLAL